MRAFLRILWLNFRRDRLVLVLSFVLPPAFFTVFAFAFGGGGSGGGEAVRVVVVDHDGSDLSRRFAASLDDSGAVDVKTVTGDGGEPVDVDVDTAASLVKRGSVDAAVILPAGFGDRYGDFTGTADPVRVIHDAANPVAAPTLAGILQQAAFTAAPEALARGGFRQFEAAAGFLTPEQRTNLDGFLGQLDASPDADETDTAETDADGSDAPTAETDDAPAGFGGLVPVETVAANRDETGRARSLTSYYAAGAGVMFLLFTAAGAAGALLDQKETGTLERLLTGGLRVRTLLLAAWLFSTAVGFAQLCVMFLWGWAAFGIDLFTPRHLLPFAAVGSATAACAAAFGLALATLARTRGQLSGLSTLLILTMSALGGSMVPKVFMPPAMQTLSRFTLNGWALDGFLDVFWYDDPAGGVPGVLAAMLPELAVLAAMTAALLAVTALLARRWEAG